MTEDKELQEAVSAVVRSTMLTAAELADDAAGYCPDDVTGPEALRAFAATIRGIADKQEPEGGREWERAMAEAHPELLPEYIRKWGHD